MLFATMGIFSFLKKRNYFHYTGFEPNIL
jgi:hypothetical protein